MVFDHFGVEHGLSQSTITGLTVDPDGFLWIATEDGLNRFNGYEFDVFRHNPLDSTSLAANRTGEGFFMESDGTLWCYCAYSAASIHNGNGTFTHFKTPHDSITIISAFLEDSKGNLWLRYRNRQGRLGVAVANQADSGFEFFNIDFPQNSALCNSYLHIVHEDRNGLIWGFSLNSLIRYNPSTREKKIFFPRKLDSAPLGPEDLLVRIIEDSRGRFWVSTRPGLMLFNKITEQFEESQPLLRKLPFIKENICLNLTVDSQGDLWFYIFNRGIVRLSKNDSITYFSPDCPNSYIPMRGGRIYGDSQNEVWITSNKHLLRFNRKNNNFDIIQQQAAQPGNPQTHFYGRMLDDRRGSFWVGTGDCGLLRIDRFKNRFKQLLYQPAATHSLAGPDVRGVIKDHQNRICIANRGAGLTVFDPQQGTCEYFFNKSPHKYDIFCVHQDADSIYWIGTCRNGLIKWNRKQNLIQQASPMVTKGGVNHQCYEIRQIYEDSHGILWLSMRGGGLYRFNKQTNKREKIAGLSFNAYEDSRGIIWYGTEQGLWRYDPQTGAQKNYHHIPGNSRSLSHNTVFKMYEDSHGRFWVGTFHGGLNLMNRETGEFKAYRAYQGLANDIVYEIQEDDCGCLWISSNNGLTRFNPETETTKIYDSEDGLPFNSFEACSSFKDKNGILYFGTERGLVWFNPDELAENPFPPPVHITNFYKFNEQVKFKDALKNIPEIKLSYKDAVFSFEFVALNYIHPEKNKYAYKLEGLHDDWILCGTQRRATFSHIPAGNYLFRVKAANNDGVWNETGDSIKLIITPPFWQTWWFKGLLALAALGLGYLVYWLRLTHFRRIERIRIRIADDLHDEIGSNLGSISMMSSMVKQGRINNGQVQEFLSTINETAVKTAESMRDIVWFIQPENNSAERIILRMRDFAARILQGIQYQFTIDEKAFSGKLDLNSKRNLYLIFKELLNNIARHSKAEKVEIAISTQNGHLCLCVTDDGTGFDTNRPVTGRGLNSIKCRARGIGAKFHISSRPGKGTQIKVTI